MSNNKRGKLKRGHMMVVRSVIRSGTQSVDCL